MTKTYVLKLFIPGWDLSKDVDRSIRYGTFKTVKAERVKLLRAWFTFPYKVVKRALDVPRMLVAFDEKYLEEVNKNCPFVEECWEATGDVHKDLFEQYRGK